MEESPGAEFYYDQPRFALIDEPSSEAGNAAGPAPEPASRPASTSPAPLPSTEAPDPAPATKRKGATGGVKKRPRRGRKKPGKANKSGPNARGSAEASEDDESDSGPYCICRGPDDHRWMIGCESCEDWFHGECIHITKDVGESLIEKFICPNCAKGNRVTLYKKTCALGACRKPARLTQDPSSVFCSTEHAQTWWERVVGRLPRVQPRTSPGEQLSQDELMAILQADLGCVGEDGAWKVARAPFSGAPCKGAGEEGTDDALSRILSDEEKAFQDSIAHARQQLAEETLLCHQMLTLIELAQDHRRAATTAGRCAEDICGYDSRLDTVSARDAFAAYARSAEGAATLGDPKPGAAPGAEDGPRGMCERKRCKVHGGWQKMLPLGIRYQIKELANQVAELGAQEGAVRAAAGERWRRRQAERNWVEVVDG